MEQSEDNHQASVSISPIKKRTSRRTLLKGSLFTALGVGIASPSALYYMKNIEPGWLVTTQLQVHLPRLMPAFHGYRLLQMSDLHTDTTWMTFERLTGIVSIVNALKPDVIVITGDFVTHRQSNSGLILAALKHLQSKDGVFGILGNHDHSSGAERVRGFLRENAIQELNDASHTIYRGNEMLHLVGLDDLWPANRGIPAPVWSHKSRLTRLSAALPEQGAAILLVHEPDFADVSASDGRYDLELSGHSHGGQVALPFRGPLVLPPLSRVYPSGMYQVKHMLHYTNRGLGMVAPQVRLNCRPEITVFDFLATKS